jgi:hypothetical protein
MVKNLITKNLGGTVYTDEIGLNVTARDIVMPCGNTTIWTNDEN